MKLIIADDHDLVRDALSTLIERDDSDTTVLQAEDFPSAFALAEQYGDVDLVLLDVYMPGMENLTSVSRFNNAFPNMPIVLMSGHIQQGDVERGFEMGAKGFIPKTMKGKALISVLNLVKSGARYVPELVLEPEQKSVDATTDDAGLSSREIDVLRQLVKGHSNKVIARNLNIEETTVKLHLRALFRKLEVSNRTEAVVTAIERGLAGSQA